MSETARSACHRRIHAFAAPTAQRIRFDNGPESFVSCRVTCGSSWPSCTAAELDFSRPGKPMDNAFAECAVSA